MHPRANRREFLQATAAGIIGPALGPPGRQKVEADRPGAVILLMLVGGPSQIDTFDPKPLAPSDVRGPFDAIPTAIPGVRVAAHLPLIARRLDRLAIVRSLHHDAAPIHETGFQLIQTGRLSTTDPGAPHIGSLAARAAGRTGPVAPFVLLPAPLGNTGVAISKAQGPGPLPPEFDPFRPGSEDFGAGLAAESPRTWERYGDTPFGRDCLRARRFVEAGSRFVVVNMYPGVFGLSWDCHGSGPFSTLEDYARRVLPAFDRAYSALIDDLAGRGLLSSTLVVATGEFGRTPRLNAAGGRDHWPGVWSALIAGGGVPGGQVIGASDALGAEPADRPVPVSALARLMADAAGVGSFVPGDRSVWPWETPTGRPGPGLASR